MSFPFQPHSSSAAAAGEAASIPLNARCLQSLGALIYETGQELSSKLSSKKTVAFTVNEIAQTIIHAYAEVYEKRVSGHAGKLAFDIFRERNLSVNFSIKGSTVAKLIQEQTLSSIDLDTSLEFNDIPLPSRVDRSLDAVRAFLASPHGRIYLRDFYVEVACDATKRLLRLDNEKTFIINRGLAAQGQSLIPLKTEDEIEILKDKFFNNLLLFAGNSTFLITFGSIDFALKVPFMESNSYIHKADSLEIIVPVHLITCHLLPAHAHIKAACTTEEALSLLSSKTIAITDPHQIKFNGFERVIYSVTQGWSVLDKDSLWVLFSELFTRIQPSEQFSDIPFERLHALLVKKTAAVGLSQTFCLRLFLNAYICALRFSKEDRDTAIVTADLFHEAFLRKEYTDIFPDYVSAHFNTFGDLNYLVSFEKLKFFLQPFSHSQLTKLTHLGEPALKAGSPSKDNGCLIIEPMALSDILKEFGELRSFLGRDKLSMLLAPYLGVLEAYDLPFEFKVFYLVFKNQLESNDGAGILDSESFLHLNRLMRGLCFLPSLCVEGGLHVLLLNYLQKNQTILPFKESDVPIFLKILAISTNAPIIGLFYEVMKSSTELEMLKAIEFAFMRKHDPVSFESLINLLIKLNSEEISTDTRFKFLQSVFVHRKVVVPAKVIMNENIKTALLSPSIQDGLDHELWAQSLEHLLSQSQTYEFYDVYLSICLRRSDLFERTVSRLNPDVRFSILKRLFVLGREDLIGVVLIHGLRPSILERLVTEEPRLFKTKSFKNALVSIPETHFLYLIEELLSLSMPLAHKALASIFESQDLSQKAQPMLHTLLKWAKVEDLDYDLNFYILKMLLAHTPSLELAPSYIHLFEKLDLSQKASLTLFKQCIDKCSYVLLAYAKQDREPAAAEGILRLMQKSVLAASLGVSFSGRWRHECDALKWETISLEEALVEYSSKPSEGLLCALHKLLEKRSFALHDPHLTRLFECLRPHSLYLLDFTKHLGIYHTDKVIERFSKEIFPRLDVEHKLEFLDQYVRYSTSLKFLTTVIQGASITDLSIEKSVALLDQIFEKASLEIKLAVLHKFRDASSLRNEHTHVICQYFLSISEPHLKKNSFIDYLASQVNKLTPKQQRRILFEPLVTFETLHGLEKGALVQRALECSKSLENLNLILAKRGQKGFDITPLELFEQLMPLYQHFLGAYRRYPAKQQEAIVKFFERFIPLFKDATGSLPQEEFLKLCSKLEAIPLYEALKEAILADLTEMSEEAIATYLTHRKIYKHFEKSDADKFMRILKRLVACNNPENAYEFYELLCQERIFNEAHKKELLPLIIANAIQEKEVLVLYNVFGKKMALGTKTGLSQTADLSFLAESSKASKKAVYEALEYSLSDISDIGELIIQVLTTITHVSDAFGADLFSDLKEKSKQMFLAFLHDAINQAKCIEELDNFVFDPFTEHLGNFEPCPEFNELFLSVLRKFLIVGEGALRDTNNKLEGFTHLLIVIHELGSVTHKKTSKAMIDLAQEDVKDAVIDALCQKILALDEDVTLISVLKKIKMHQVELVDPLLKKLVLVQPESLFHVINSDSIEDIVILFKALKGCPELFYTDLGALLKERVKGDDHISLISFAFETIGLNMQLADAIIAAFRTYNKAEKYAEFLSCSFEVFVAMLHRSFDLKTELENVLALLELRRLKDGLKMYTYVMKLKEAGNFLHSTYMIHFQEEQKTIFYDELEAARVSFGKSSLSYAHALMSKEPLIAKLYFTKHSEMSIASILDEIRVVDFKNYFSNFLVIYNYWILPEKYQEYYPAILDNTFERLETVIALNSSRGDLDVHHLHALCEMLNTLALSYKSVLPGSGYPMGERLNHLFLGALSIILEPKNILKEGSAFAAILTTIFRSIKNEHIIDLMKPELRGPLDHLFRSLLRFYTLDAKDYCRKGGLSNYEFQSFLSSSEMQKQVSMTNIMMSLTQFWMPEMIVREIDLLIPYFTLVNLLKLDLMSIVVKKSFFIKLNALCYGYQMERLSSHAPTKGQEIITRILALFDGKKVARDKKEQNAMTNLYALPAQDLKDYIFHTCQVKIQETQKALEELSS